MHRYFSFDKLPLECTAKKSGVIILNMRNRFKYSDTEIARVDVLIEEIYDDLLQLQDVKYRDFQSKLIPTIDSDIIIGVRTPELRKYAKLLVKRENVQSFLRSLPHKYFEENQLHAFIISEIKNYEKCIDEVNRFLPYVDNWATCDQMSPKVFRNNRKKLLKQIKYWINSNKNYVIRFGVKMLMQHFLDKDFDPIYLDMVSEVKSEDYYVNMMVAWYFATALAKQFDAALSYIENRKLNPWVHNKAIQKSLESYRVAAEDKRHLKSLKIKGIKLSFLEF